jgi:hypothetical protein
VRRPREVDPHQDWPTMIRPVDGERLGELTTVFRDERDDEIETLRGELREANSEIARLIEVTEDLRTERDQALNKLADRDDLGTVSLPLLPDSVRHDPDPGEFPDMPPLVEEGKWEPSLPLTDWDEWLERFARGEWPWVLPQRVPGEALKEVDDGR